MSDPNLQAEINRLRDMCREFGRAAVEHFNRELGAICAAEPSNPRIVERMRRVTARTVAFVTL